MVRIKTFFSLVLVLLTMTAFSQKKDSVKVHLNHYTLTVGAGWTHYIDNLENGNNSIRKDFAGVCFKFFWEPEYLLSLGLETGYYTLFRTTNQINPDTAFHVDRVVVPMLLLVRMRIVDNVYLGAGMGLAFITSKVTGVGEKIQTKTTSLSNFDVSASYIYPLGKHMQVGGEAKIYYFGNLDDWMYTLQATFAFRL